jgi:hypothetical protein
MSTISLVLTTRRPRGTGMGTSCHQSLNMYLVKVPDLNSPYLDGHYGLDSSSFGVSFIINTTKTIDIFPTTVR